MPKESYKLKSIIKTQWRVLSGADGGRICKDALG
jgi:hypothetical protein